MSAVNLDEWVAQARAYLATVQKQIEARGLEASSEVRIGFAVNEIVGAAYKAGAGLIAIATHGHSGVGRWVLGSTADGVLRRSEFNDHRRRRLIRARSGARQSIG
jgi:nucleotide-binding universal stress UspA family protein